MIIIYGLYYFPSMNERLIEVRFDDLEMILAIAIAPLSVTLRLVKRIK